MHASQNTQLSSLSLVLPRPPLPKRTSSIRSSTESFPSPRTPRTSIGLSSPTLFKLDSAVPRRSTDSWNSSVYDGGDDDMDWEWTSDQLSLLNKTLDALPSHLLSPFNGAIPPPNVLDKISRSIIHAKDPLEWPHSIRATRIKLLKLARSRIQENMVLEGRRSYDSPTDVLQPTTNVPKKPLYRQSSMDFLKGNTLKNDKNIDRLSSRLQRIDRIISDPAHEYNVSRTPSPHSIQGRPLSIGEPPYTPKTPKLDDHPTGARPSSLSGGRGSRLRRTTTTLTGLPTIPSGVASDCISAEKPSVPRAPKVKRSESFSSPNFTGLGHSLKRAPSYGSVSSRMSIDDQKENSPQLIHLSSELDIYPSSDEEEKTRSQNVKKQKTTGPPPTGHSHQAKKAKVLPKSSSAATIKASGTTPKDTRSRKTSAKKVPRTSSMFGAELPNPQAEPAPAVPHVEPLTVSPDEMFELPIENMEIPPVTPNRRLRRVKTTNFPPRVKRRISFGHLSAPAEINESVPAGVGLGSAIQLR